MRPLGRATQWIEAARRGDTKPQKSRLEDGSLAYVKFAENQQGPYVLANELLCSLLAELMEVPVPKSFLVEVPDHLLDGPRTAGICPSEFRGGVHVGTEFLEHAEDVPILQIEARVASTSNRAKWPQLVLFNEWVKRDDKPEVLLYSDAQRRLESFVGVDYGMVFGGTPNWNHATLLGLDEPYLDNTKDNLCAELRPIIERMRDLTHEQLQEVIADLGCPRFGVTQADADGLAQTLTTRAHQLVEQYDMFCS
jgi:hypothetical protein